MTDQPDTPPPFDLTAFVETTLPGLVEAEAGWDSDYYGNTRPATAMASEGSPLAAFLSSPTEPPEGASRAERAAFYDLQAAARAEAVEACQGVLADHAWSLSFADRRRASDQLTALMYRASVAAGDLPGRTRPPVKTPGPDFGGW